MPPSASPASLRMTPANNADDKKDEAKSSGSSGEGDRDSTDGATQENRRPKITFAARTAFAVPVNDDSCNSDTNRVNIPSPESGAGPTDEGRENAGSNRTTRESPPPGAGSINNGSGSSAANRTPSPRLQPGADQFRRTNSQERKRKQKEIERALDREHRRDLLESEGIAVRDLQAEVDARVEGSLKKKGKKAVRELAPVRRKILRPPRPPPENDGLVRNLRAQVIAQAGFETHFEVPDPDLDEEELYKPQVKSVEQADLQGVPIIPIRHGRVAQYPAGSMADQVDLQLRERRREQRAARRAWVIEEANRRGRESVQAKAAVVAHAAAVANCNDEDEDEDAGELSINDEADDADS